MKTFFFFFLTLLFDAHKICVTMSECAPYHHTNKHRLCGCSASSVEWAVHGFSDALTFQKTFLRIFLKVSNMCNIG
jgi:hypothetical protein